MKKTHLFRTLLLAGGAVLALCGTARADFSPIALNPASFNQDVVVEAAAPIALNAAINATMDQGTNRNGNTWFERGYMGLMTNGVPFTNGLPPANSIVVNSTGDHKYVMPPDYHTNNVIMVGHNNGGQTPLMLPGTAANPARLTLTTPAAFTALTFLSSSGNGPVNVGYTVNYADLSSESGTFTSVNWFDPPTAVFNAAGRISMGGALQNIDANPACRAFQADVNLGNSAVNVTSVDFYYVSSGATPNANNNGRAVIFAISGAKDGSIDFTNTLAVTGFTYDAVVEADAPQTTGGQAAYAPVPAQATGNITNNITASMDGGTSKGGSVWYEKGYYAPFPKTGIPAAGSTVTSAWYSARYTMPSSYAGNCATVLASNITSGTISFSTPAAYGALSFLCATANGDTTLPCVINFQDGSSETNAIFVPDWFNRALPWAYLSFGRVNPNNRTINNSFEQFVDPFATPYPFSFDFRNLAAPPGRLFDAVITVTNTASPITSIALSLTNAASTRVASIFAVSGAPVGNVPPIFGATGSSAPGQPANAIVANNITLIKGWEGTNNIVLSATNIAGTGPISYQWQKAARGGGLRDKMYSFDYSTFTNVVNGGRVSGANSSALVISNALSADSADYLVVASNPSGSITSQVATVMILTTNQSLLVGGPAGDIIANYTGDGSPAAESIDHASDRVLQKWLSFGFTAGQALPFQGPSGYTVTPVSGASIATAMRFYTANDTPGRDPMDYSLEGSNDGATWTPIAGGKLAGTLRLPGGGVADVGGGTSNTGRNGTGVTPLDALSQNVIEVDFLNATGYKSYRVTITNTIDRLRQGLMQIAEIELLGSLVPNPPVIVRQPDPAVKVFVGASPTFTVSASGYPPPTYQWYKGATLIPGATSSSYTFPNAQLADSGTTFHCVAGNIFAQVPSGNATLTVIAAPTQPYPVAALADNPIGYWRLNEGPEDGAGNNGVLTHDYRGGHNGYYSNAVLVLPGYNPATDPDTAAQFGSPVNVNSFVVNINDVDFARATNAGGGTFSVESWVFGGSQPVNAAIVSKGYNGALTVGTGTGTEQFVLDVLGTAPNQTFRFLVRDAAGNGHVAQSSIVPYDPILLQATWHHLVGVCDQPNGKVYLYVDGLLAASGDIGATAGILTQPLPMVIGSRKSSGAADYDNQWVGSIDDVAIYNSALSSSQVLGHFYAAQRPPVITLQPVNQTTPENVTVTFPSSAYGPGTITYQWYLSDGANPTAPVGGQTSSNLTFTTTAAQNGKMYQLVATSQYGSATGAVAQLTVVSGLPSFFVDLPSSGTYLIGHVVQLRVDVGGTAPFTYQWQKNGLNISDNYRISGSHTNVLIIGYATNADSGSYQVLVTNGQGTTPSTVDVITVTNSSSTATPFNASGTGWTQQGTPSLPVMGANRLELTSGLGNTARSAFLTDKQAIGSFNASFVYQTVSGAGGADGVTFCFQNDTRGATAVGAGGGGLGYGTITPSLALALNIYDPNTRGVGFLQNGAVTPPFSPATPVLVGGNANPIQINVSYAGGVLMAAFRDTVTAATFTTNITVNIPTIVGSDLAYIGFTGADGGVASTQVISSFTMLPPPVALKSQLVGNSLVLSWPATTGAFLKSTPSLTNPVWTDVTSPLSVVGNQIQVTVAPLVGSQFYRLEVYP